MSEHSMERVADDEAPDGAARVRSVGSPVFGATCYIVSSGRDAVVVDPGVGVAEAVAAAVTGQGLQVHAVLVTHGHPDHTWDAGAVAETFGVPLVVHRADTAAASDPMAALGGAPGTAGGAVGAAFAAAAATAAPPREASRLTAVDGASTLRFGDLELEVIPAPGHTPGSILLRFGSVVLTGDVLFAGTIGRTDLPGGDMAAMQATLDEVVARLDPALTVLPGHGPSSTIARELATNPFLTT